MTNLIFGSASPTFSTGVGQSSKPVTQTSTPVVITSAPSQKAPATFNLINNPLAKGGSSIGGTQTSTPSQIASGGGIGSLASGALSALQRAGSSVSGLFGSNTGSNSSLAAGVGLADAPAAPPPTYSSYGGNTGVDQTTYGTTMPKGQTSLPGADTSGPQYQVANAVNDAATKAKATREAQAAVLQAQIEQNKKDTAAQSAVSQATTDSTYDPSKVTAINDAKTQQAALEAQYQSLLQPSAEEQAAQAQEDQLTAGESQVNADLNQKVTDVNKEAIPLGFLQGWGTTFNKDATAKLQTIASQKVPLQLQLARLAATRQAAMGVTKDRVDNAKDAVSQAYSTYDTQHKDKQTAAQNVVTQAAAQKKFDEDVREFGITTAQKNYENATGRINANANAQNKATPLNYTSSQKQTLVGAGVPSAQIDTLNTYINQYGLDAALKNSDLTQKQKDALTAIYQ